MKNKEVVFILVVLVPFILISLFGIPYSDDLCFFFKYTSDNTIWKTAMYMYNTKEGRFMSIGGLMQIASFKYLNFGGTTFLWAILFILCLFIITLIITKTNNLSSILYKQLIDNQTVNNRTQVISKNTIKIFLITLVLSMISLEGILDEIVYWKVGGSYIPSLLVNLTFIYFIEKKSNYIPILVFAILSSTTGPNFTIPILFLYIFNVINEKRSSESGAYKTILKSATVVVVFIIGLIILIKSPGTQNRLNSISTFWMWHPKYILEVLIKIFLSAVGFYWMSLVLIIVSLIIEFRRALKDDSQGILVISFNLLYSIRFFLAALLSIFVFIKTPGVFTDRAAFFYMILVLIQFLISIRGYIQNPIVLLGGKVASIVISLMLCYTFYNYKQIYNSYWSDIEDIHVTNIEFNNRYQHTGYSLPFKKHKAFTKEPQNSWVEECTNRYRKEIYGIE